MTHFEADLLALFLWGVVLIVLPIACVRFLRKNSRHPFAELNAYLAIPLCSLIWIHGVVFNTPNNTAVYARLGVLGFWFQFEPVFRLAQHATLALCLIVPAGVAAVLAWRAAPRRVQRSSSESELLRVLAFAFTVLSGLLLHHFPDLLMDVAMHAPDRFSHLEEFIDWPLKELLLVLIIAGIPAAIAVRLTRRAAQSG